MSYAVLYAAKNEIVAKSNCEVKEAGNACMLTRDFADGTMEAQWEEFLRIMMRRTTWMFAGLLLILWVMQTATSYSPEALVMTGVCAAVAAGLSLVGWMQLKPERIVFEAVVSTLVTANVIIAELLQWRSLNTCNGEPSKPFECFAINHVTVLTICGLSLISPRLYARIAQIGVCWLIAIVATLWPSEHTLGSHHARRCILYSMFAIVAAVLSKSHKAVLLRQFESLADVMSARSTLSSLVEDLDRSLPRLLQFDCISALLSTGSPSLLPSHTEGAETVVVTYFLHRPSFHILCSFTSTTNQFGLTKIVPYLTAELAELAARIRMQDTSNLVRHHEQLLTGDNVFLFWDCDPGRLTDAVEMILSNDDARELCKGFLLEESPTNLAAPFGCFIHIGATQRAVVGTHHVEQTRVGACVSECFAVAAKLGNSQERLERGMTMSRASSYNFTVTTTHHVLVSVAVRDELSRRDILCERFHIQSEWVVVRVQSPVITNIPVFKCCRISRDGGSSSGDKLNGSTGKKRQRTSIAGGSGSASYSGHLHHPISLPIVGQLDAALPMNPATLDMYDHSEIHHPSDEGELQSPNNRSSVPSLQLAKKANMLLTVHPLGRSRFTSQTIENNFMNFRLQAYVTPHLWACVSALVGVSLAFVEAVLVFYFERTPREGLSVAGSVLATLTTVAYLTVVTKYRVVKSKRTMVVMSLPVSFCALTMSLIHDLHTPMMLAFTVSAFSSTHSAWKHTSVHLLLLALPNFIVLWISSFSISRKVDTSIAWVALSALLCHRNVDMETLMRSQYINTVVYTALNDDHDVLLRTRDKVIGCVLLRPAAVEWISAPEKLRPHVITKVLSTTFSYKTAVTLSMYIPTYSALMLIHDELDLVSLVEMHHKQCAVFDKLCNALGLEKISTGDTVNVIECGARHFESSSEEMEKLDMSPLWQQRTKNMITVWCTLTVALRRTLRKMVDPTNKRCKMLNREGSPLDPSVPVLDTKTKWVSSLEVGEARIGFESVTKRSWLVTSSWESLAQLMPNVNFIEAEANAVLQQCELMSNEHLLAIPTNTARALYPFITQDTTLAENQNPVAAVPVQLDLLSQLMHQAQEEAVPHPSLFLEKGYNPSVENDGLLSASFSASPDQSIRNRERVTGRLLPNIHFCCEAKPSSKSNVAAQGSPRQLQSPLTQLPAAISADLPPLSGEGEEEEVHVCEVFEWSEVGEANRSQQNSSDKSDNKNSSAFTCPSENLNLLSLVTPASDPLPIPHNRGAEERELSDIGSTARSQSVASGLPLQEASFCVVVFER